MADSASDGRAGPPGSGFLTGIGDCPDQDLAARFGATTATFLTCDEDGHRILSVT